MKIKLIIRLDRNNYLAHQRKCSYHCCGRGHPPSEHGGWRGVALVGLPVTGIVGRVIVPTVSLLALLLGRLWCGRGCLDDLEYLLRLEELVHGVDGEWLHVADGDCDAGGDDPGPEGDRLALVLHVVAVVLLVLAGGGERGDH